MAAPPPVVVITPTRPRRGCGAGGTCAKRGATSSSPSNDPTRAMPQACKKTSAISSAPAKDPVCDCASSAAASDRPSLKAATGFPRFAASCAKWRSLSAWRICSKNNKKPVTSGSSSAARQTSPIDRSASPPTETSPANPSPLRLPRDINAPIKLPLCEATNSPPTGRSGSAKAALAVSVMPVFRLARPMDDGPSTRNFPRAISACSRSVLA